MVHLQGAHGGDAAAERLPGTGSGRCWQLRGSHAGGEDGAVACQMQHRSAASVRAHDGFHPLLMVEKCQRPPVSVCMMQALGMRLPEEPLTADGICAAVGSATKVHTINVKTQVGHRPLACGSGCSDHVLVTCLPCGRLHCHHGTYR